jgi:hypothetical protein
VEPRATYSDGTEIPAAIGDIEVKWPPEPAPKYPRSARTYKASSAVCLVLFAVCLLIGLPTLAFGGWIFLLIGAPFGLMGRMYRRAYKELTAAAETEEKPEA